LLKPDKEVGIVPDMWLSNIHKYRLRDVRRPSVEGRDPSRDKCIKVRLVTCFLALHDIPVHGLHHEYLLISVAFGQLQGTTSSFKPGKDVVMLQRTSAVVSLYGLLKVLEIMANEIIDINVCRNMTNIRRALNKKSFDTLS
jgi:hypothetical protein